MIATTDVSPSIEELYFEEIWLIVQLMISTLLLLVTWGIATWIHVTARHGVALA